MKALFQWAALFLPGLVLLNACGDDDVTRPSDQFLLKTPTSLHASQGEFSNRVSLRWAAVENAEYYVILRGLTDDRTALDSIGRAGNVIFDDKNVEIGVYYYYAVQAWDNSRRKSDYSAIARGHAAVLQHSRLTEASDGEFDDRIEVDWESIVNANAYAVYRSTDPEQLGDSVARTSESRYTDSGPAVQAMQTYYYRIITISNELGRSVPGDADAGFRRERYTAQVSFGAAGQGPGAFESIDDMDLSPDGSVLYVLDRRRVRIQRFTTDGGYLGELGGFGLTEGRFVSPTAVAVAPDGKVYVGDAGPDVVLVYDAAGTYLRSIGGSGVGNGKFNNSLRMLDVDNNGNLFVVEQNSWRVQKFDMNGAFLLAFGRYGRDDGEFLQPWGIGVTTDGSVFVSDIERGDIQHFNAAGEFQSAQNFNGAAIHANGEFLYRPERSEVVKQHRDGRIFARLRGQGAMTLDSAVAGVESANRTAFVADAKSMKILRFASPD